MKCADEHPGILIVDDERMVRTMLQLALERSGFNVWAAGNGREAIRLYRAQRDRINLVLLDVRMPDLDGPATLDALRELDSDVVACFMSGDLGSYSSEDLLRDGVARIFDKPFRLFELADALYSLAIGQLTVVK